MPLEVWATLAHLIILIVTNAALRLYPCDRSGYRDVVENTSVTFHCDQYSGSVEWKYKGPRSTTPSPISQCDATKCTASFDHVFTSTYISADNSSLTSTLTSRSLGVAGGEYRCGNLACKVHIIVPASVSTPTSFITRTDEGYFLHCQTRITNAYSSEGQYSCEWQNGRTQVTGTLKLQPPPHDTNNTSDRMGTCNATLKLSNPSDAICNVTVSPGNVVASSGLVRPTQPKISCPTCPVPENTNITCTCTTDKLGQHGGRLVWYAGSNGVFDMEIARGNIDVNKLTMTWPLNRSDHNVTMFRCVNEWLENVTALTDFTAILNWDAPFAETPKPEFWIVPVIAGSIGGVVVVVGVVVAIVCVIKRKRKGVQNTSSGHSRNGNHTAREDDPDYDIEIVNVCYESAESTIGQVPGSHYEYIDTRLSMNPTLPVAAYAQPSHYAEKENITDEYACVRRDR